MIKPNEVSAAGRRQSKQAPLGDLTKESLEMGLQHIAFAGDYRHWYGHYDDQGVLWLMLDKRNAITNTLSEDVLLEFANILSGIEREPPVALVIRSGKHNGFSYGADISELRGITNANAALARAQRGHAIMQRLERLPLTVIALLHGQCLGAGLELALACSIRIARHDAELGFPEIQLGLHPGLGGTARLTSTIAPDDALRMLLTGKSVSAVEASKLGLVDALGEERHFANAVRAAVTGALQSQAGGASVRLMHNAAGRRLIARQARKQTAERLRAEHYPAPFQLIDLWEEHGASPTKLLQAEPHSYATLLAGDTAQNLIRVGFLQEQLREQLPASGTQHNNAIQHVHIIGAGVTGSAIGACCALQGMRVTLEDVSAESLAPAMRRAHALFQQQPDKHRRRAAWDRLLPDEQGIGRRQADLIIEAVPEKLELKQGLYASLEPQLKADAILASCTSSLPLEALARWLRVPERFVGLHFFNLPGLDLSAFNPLAPMPLVEVVLQTKLANAVREQMLVFVQTLDWLPLPVRDAPGFLVNRILTPYLMEALQLLEEGVAAEEIDASAVAFGMPLGPLALVDHIGLDIVLQMADTLNKALPQAQAAVPQWLRDKLEQQQLGRKSGVNLDEHVAGEVRRAAFDGEPDPQLQDRLLLPMLNACMQCLQEGIVDTADALDAAIIFATGFAPFRGGPLHYARQRGYANIASTLEQLAVQLGERFQPVRGWR